jgi:hypothetical protein
MNYTIVNNVTGTAWRASRGEAMVYATGELAYHYTVRAGSSMMPLSMSDLLAGFGTANYDK